MAAGCRTAPPGHRLDLAPGDAQRERARLDGDQAVGLPHDAAANTEAAELHFARRGRPGTRRRDLLEKGFGGPETTVGVLRLSSPARLVGLQAVELLADLATGVGQERLGLGLRRAP